MNIEEAENGNDYSYLQSKRGRWKDPHGGHLGCGSYLDGQVRPFG